MNDTVATPNPDSITSALELFPGAEVVATERPLFCRDCDKALIADRERPYSEVSSIKDLVSLLDQRKSRIVQKTWPDGHGEWICSHCGRAVQVGDTKSARQKDKRIEKPELTRTAPRRARTAFWRTLTRRKF